MTPALLALLVAVAPRVAVPAEAEASRARYVASRAGSGRGLALPSHEAYGFSQRARLLPDGTTEVTVVAVARGTRLPVRVERPDGGAMTLDGDVRLLAEELTHGAADDWEASDRILTWVSLNVRHADEPAHAEDAAATLRARTGSCVGRSVLSAELLRAAGIPARTVHGLLAEPAGGMPFTLHRFVEAWIDGVGWVPSDPGESVHVVDARHVFIATDDGDYDPESQRGLSLRIAEPLTAPLAAPLGGGHRPLFVAEAPRTAGSRSGGP